MGIKIVSKYKGKAILEQPQKREKLEIIGDQQQSSSFKIVPKIKKEKRLEDSKNVRKRIEKLEALESSMNQQDRKNLRIIPKGKKEKNVLHDIEKIRIEKNKKLKDLEMSIDQRGNLFYRSKYISNIHLEITKEECIVDEERRMRLIECRCYFNNSEQLHKIKIAVEDFERTIVTELKKVIGIKFRIVQDKKLQEKFIDSIYALSPEEIPTETVFTTCGWHKLNNWGFIHAHGAIGCGNINSESFKANENLSNYIIDRIDIKPKHAYQSVLNMLEIAPLRITLPLTANMLTSLIFTFWNIADRKPQFILWLHGESGSRKTTLGLLISHIFKKQSKTIPATFKDTKAAIEHKLYEYKDCVLTIDDYHPVTNFDEKKEMDGKAHYIIRACGDNVSKSRMNNKMQKQKEYPPQGMALITGEKFIEGTSSQARTVSIPINKNDVCLDKLTKAQNNVLSTSTSIYNYIEWLSKKADELPNKLRRKFDNHRTELLKDYSHGRMSEAIAWMLTSYELFLKYGLKIKAITEKEYADKFKVARKTLIEVMKEQEKNSHIDKPEYMFLTALEQMVESKSIVISNINEKSSKNEHIVGWMDDDYYYLIPDITFNSVVGFWRRQNKMFPLGKDKLLEYLEKEGLIEVEMSNTDGRVYRTKKKMIPFYSRRRVIYLKKHQMDEYLNKYSI